ASRADLRAGVHDQGVRVGLGHGTHRRASDHPGHVRWSGQGGFRGRSRIHLRDYASDPGAAHPPLAARELGTQRPATERVAGRCRADLPTPPPPSPYAVVVAPCPLPLVMPNTLERPPVTASQRLREVIRSSSCWRSLAISVSTH